MCVFVLVSTFGFCFVDIYYINLHNKVKLFRDHKITYFVLTFII